ncbi:hypothetical protein D3C84_912730 [compost metagenome]
MVKIGVVFDLPDTEANVITAVHRGIALVEHLFEARLDRGDVHPARAGQQRDKFIVAEPADHVVFAKGDTQHIREGFQGAVALGTAIQIIDLLELIEVEEQQRRWQAHLLAGIQPQLGKCGETVAIGE